MPYEAQKNWDKKNLIRLNLALTQKSGIPDALQKMQKKTGEKPLDYAKRALIEQLEFDGYLMRKK